MTFRYKITVTYDGTNFAGFQRQPKQRTVESELTKAVNKMAKLPSVPIVIYGAGRTDAGVHALGQVVHFDLPYKLPTESVRKGLNSMLPLDMEVLTVEQVSQEFHARYDTVGKRYVYRVDMEEFVNPFKRNYTGHYKYHLKPALIQQALPDLVGMHDFSSFVASGSQAKNHVRMIYSATMVERPTEHELVFEFCGSGFLYNQVRIMVATLLEIGNEKRPVHDFLRLYQIKNRQEARGTAPASGLYMKKVYYDQAELEADLSSKK